MAFFKNISELQRYVTVSKDLTLEKLLPDLNYVEQQIIRPLIGAEMFDDIYGKYNTEASEDTLIVKIQQSASNLAMAFFSDVAQVTISDQGLQRREDETHKTPFKYQQDGVRNYFLRKGFEYLEIILEYLEENKGEEAYTKWVESSAYTLHKQLLINSAREFNVYYPIHNSRITFKAMSHLLQYAEFAIEEVIGADLLAEIKTAIKGGSLAGDNKRLCDTYLRPAFAHLVMAEALQDMPASVVDGAVLIYQFKSPTGAELVRPAQEAINLKRQLAIDRGLFYLKKTTEYLNANASADKYAAYFNSSLYENPEAEEAEEDEDSNIYGAF